MKAAAPFIASPVISDQNIYLGSLDSQFYAVNLNSGTIQWKFKTNGEIRSTATIIDGIVYFTSSDGNCYALKTKDGSVSWRFQTGPDTQYDFADYYQSSPIIADSLVYVGFGNGAFHALHVATGKSIWKYQTNGPIRVRAAIDSDRIFVGSFDGTFYALNRHSGELLWNFKTIGHRYFSKGEVMGNPVAGYGLVHFGARDYNEYSLDQDSGFAYWNKRFARGWGLALTLTDSVLYVGTSDDRVLIAYDPVWGAELWRTNLGFNIFGPPTRKDSTIYVGTLQGRMFALDTKSGAIQWSFATDGYRANHLNYFKPDDSFRDDIFDIVTSNEGFIAVEYEVGAFFSSPAETDSLLVISSSDGTLYCLRRK
jgi:outer membrane protein assembly factor BamB